MQLNIQLPKRNPAIYNNMENLEDIMLIDISQVRMTNTA